VQTLTRSIGVALASAGCAATLALSTSTSAVAANKALMVNGLAAGQLSDIAMANILGGMFGGNKIVRQNVPWPQQARPITGPDSLTLTESVAKGVVNLDTELTKALAQLGPGETVTIVGLSAGALVVNDEVRKLANDPNAPDKSQLKIVVVADSSRVGFNKNRYDGIIGYQYRVPAETKYDTIAVFAEYDGFADFPDRWWNFLAVANALAGNIVQHIPTMLTDLSTVPASNITVTTNSLGGVTTSYLIPAPRLPLVILLPFLAPQEAELKKTIDTAYIRNDNKNSAAAVTATTAVAGGPAEIPVLDAGLPAPEAAVPAPDVDVPALDAPEVDAPEVLTEDAPLGSRRSVEVAPSPEDAATEALLAEDLPAEDLPAVDLPAEDPGSTDTASSIGSADDSGSERSGANRRGAQRPSA
jgi:hypothetical protein